MAFTALTNNTTNNTAGRIANVLNLKEGGVDSIAGEDFKVTASGTGRILNIHEGKAYVPNGNWVQGSEAPEFFLVTSSTEESVEISANNSGNPRIDLVYIKKDTAVSGGVQGADAVSIEVVEGTPASSPVAPAIPDTNYLEIGRISVPDSVATLTAGNITDTRKQAVIKDEYIGDGAVTGEKLGQQICASVSRSTPQSIATSLDQFATFPTVLINNGGMFNPANNDRFTIQEDGLYVMSGFVRWAPRAEGRRFISVVLNAGIDPLTEPLDTGLVNDGAIGQSLTTPPTLLSAGDFVRLRVYQNSLTPLDLNIATFSIIKVGT